MQGLVQGLGFLSGLLVIRLLTPEQYAYYTIAYAGLGMLTILCDGGISSGVMALGGKCWQDPSRLGIVFSAGMRLRYRLAGVGVILSFPFLFALFVRQGATVPIALILCVAIVPIFIATLTGQLREVVVKLHQELLLLQAVQLGAVMVRILLLAALLTFFPSSWLALLLAGLAQWVANVVLRHVSTRFMHAENSPDPSVDSELKAYVKKTLPGAFYYAFAGQISIWLISFFGSADAVAKVGVAGRIAMICTVFGSVFNILVIPRFARLQGTGKQLLMRFSLAMLAILVFGLMIALVIFLIPNLAGLLAGHEYDQIQKEVLWSMISAVLAMAGGAAYALGAVRGIIMRPHHSIGVAIASNVILISTFNLTTAVGVLRLNSAYGAIILVMFVAYVGRQLCNDSEKRPLAQ